ncbi:MAG: hypothetical protein Q9160_005588 [Pyrenula sp. 1 TL-2023]
MAQDSMQHQHLPAQRSNKSRMKNISAKDLPSDVGLLPDLFIFPRTNGAAPKFLSKDVWKRIKLELFYLREQAKSIAALWYELRMQRSGDKRIPLSVGNRIPKAVNLHQAMYINLSAGNTSVLDRICCETLAGKLRSQIDRRRISNTDILAPNWVLERYTGPMLIPPTIPVEPRWLRRLLWFQFPLSALWGYLVPGVWAKVVSDRATTIPIGISTLLRQVVVRIRSRQRVYYPKKVMDEGNESWERDLKVQDLTEYVVIQQMIVEGQEADAQWKIWGTVQEADEKGVEKLLSKGWSGTEGEKQKSLSALDRIKATMM